MKKLLILVLALGVSGAYAQKSDKKEKGDVNWKEVILTKNTDDIKGFTFVEEVDAKAQKPFGSQSSLTKKAREKLKKSAAELGATLVLIEESNFSNSPLNNVYIFGKAYKKD